MNHVAHIPSTDPYYTGKVFIPTKRCDVCENVYDEHNTVTIKECGTTYCSGCAKMVNVSEIYRDSTPSEIESITKQLKTI